MWLGDTQLGLTESYTHKVSKKIRAFFLVSWFVCCCEFAGSLTDRALRFRHPVPCFWTLDQGQGRPERFGWSLVHWSSFVNQIHAGDNPQVFPYPFFSSWAFPTAVIFIASHNGMGGIILESYNGQVNLKWIFEVGSAQLWQNDKPSYQKMGNW